MLLVYVSARPLYTDDAWWHLAYGLAFLDEGPWLDSDPLLFDPAGPAQPASWLFDVGLALVWRTTGFTGLRILHAAAVLAILAGAYRLLRRSSDSLPFAAWGTATFAVLAAYRLFQLRPELVTIGATLALFGWLIAPRIERSRLASLGLAIGLGALWANLHAGFLLAPLLLAVAAAGVAGDVMLNGPRPTVSSWRRVRQLSEAAVASALGALINPLGLAAMLPYLRSGESTPKLASIYDEWAPLDLLQLPVRDVTPTPLDWLLLWGLLLATAAGATWWLRNIRDPKSVAREVDPASIAISCAAWLAMAVAVRFLWLSIFPILLVGQLSRPGAASTARSDRARAWVPALAALLLIPCFLQWGIWQVIARGVPATPRAYSMPYAIAKHPGHALTFLRDTGVTGNLLAPYSSGGFVGFWLAPRLRVLANGSLNIEPEAMRAYLALQSRQGAEGMTFEETLSRRDVDIFLGSGLPGYRPSHRRPFTTTHLERAEGWVLIFRSLASSVYLRDHPRNRENFERVARYFEANGIDFDLHRGFDVVETLRRAPEWSVRRGLAPIDIAALEQAASSQVGGARIDGLARLAAIRAGLGLYADALAADEELLSWRPRDRRALERRLYCLIHLDRRGEIPAVAERLAAISTTHPISRVLEATARRYASERDPDQRAALASLMPLFDRAQAGALTRGFLPPPLPTDRARPESALVRHAPADPDGERPPPGADGFGPR